MDAIIEKNSINNSEKVPEMQLSLRQPKHIQYHEQILVILV